MLKMKTVSKSSLPSPVPIDIRGETIIFNLRPWDAQVAKEIRDRFIKGFEWGRAPETGQRIKIEQLDDEGFFDAMVDYVVASFEGLGDEEGVHWPIDLEHKKMAISITVPKDAPPVWEQVIEQAKQLAFVRDEAQAAQLGN